MATRFTVQGRIVVWRGGRIARDDTLHADADSHAEAQVAAGRMAAQGYTTWIFRLMPGPGSEPRYTLVETGGSRTKASAGTGSTPRSTSSRPGSAA